MEILFIVIAILWIMFSFKVTSVPEQQRKPEDKFVYCKLHVLYAFQPKGQKEDLITKEDEVPAFLEKKIKSA